MHLLGKNISRSVHVENACPNPQRDYGVNYMSNVTVATILYICRDAVSNHTGLPPV